MVPTYDPTLSPTLAPTLEPTLSVSIQLYKLSRWSSLERYPNSSSVLPSHVKFVNLFPFLLNHTAYSLSNLIAYTLTDAVASGRSNFEPN